jgi:hypothetical protein
MTMIRLTPMLATRSLLAFPFAAIFLLSACSGKKAEAIPENETVMETDINDNLSENIEEPEMPVAAPAPEPAVNTARALPPPEVPDEVQIRDDADATGLTARIDETAANETQPAN